MLQAFLSKYVDETAVSRRRSQSEEDHPQSLVTLDNPAEPSQHFLSHSRTVASPGQRAEVGGLRFHAPLTPSGSSNPHTPASPHMGNISQVMITV